MARTSAVVLASICFVQIFLYATVKYGTAQGPPTAGRAKVVVKKLQGSFYPPIANFARIGGAAEVGIIVRQDGSIESARVMQAPAILNQAALDVAKLALPLLDCHMCNASGADYVMHLTFEPGKNLGNCADSTNGIANGQWQGQHSEDEVSITAGDRVLINGAWTCVVVDYASYRARALRCAYLWKCKLVSPNPVFKNIEDPDLPHQLEPGKS